jgi:hypothetical protein
LITTLSKLTPLPSAEPILKEKVFLSTRRVFSNSNARNVATEPVYSQWGGGAGAARPQSTERYRTLRTVQIASLSGIFISRMVVYAAYQTFTS